MISQSNALMSYLLDSLACWSPVLFSFEGRDLRYLEDDSLLSRGVL